MLKVKVVNVTFGNSHTISTQCKPSKGDLLSINYTNEAVDSVVFVTQMIIDNYKDLNLVSYDLLVFTK